MMKVILSLLLFLITSYASYYLYNGLYGKAYQGPEVYFAIKPGETFGSINYRLGKNELIHSTSFFYQYCKWKGLMTRFRAGTYSIPSNTHLVGVVNILVYGDSITHTVTIPEGKNIYEIAKILAEKDLVNYDEFIHLAKDPVFVQSLALPPQAKTVEGYLFPETYKFEPQQGAESVIRTMVQVFRHKMEDIEIKDSKLDPFQTLVMASMIEKETGAKTERGAIAGVFYNRLQKRMRLASDPTTIYGMYERYDGNIRRSDLIEKNEYNTYQIKGLPVGPICNPGMDAIRAAVYPEKNDYLFFVSKNDGSHLFTKTYGEHSKGVDAYQKHRKNKKQNNRHQ